MLKLLTLAALVVAACGDNIHPLVPGDANGCLLDGDAVASVDARFDDAACPDAPNANDGPAVDCAIAAPVNLRTAGDFVILAKSAITVVPLTVIVGDIGISPAAETFITGLSLIDDVSTTFATSAQVTGQVFAADMTPPTPAKMTQAISDMETAFTDAASRAPDVIELGAGNIGGMNLKPCVYKWGTGLLIPTSVTLTGTASDVWIFQVAQTVLLANAARIVLAGGASASNVFWQVAEGVTLGTTSHLEGVVIGQTAISLNTGASVVGQLLAQTAVTLDMNTVVRP